jgi:tetratricopeptide (TPR) repeat protein
MVLYARTGRDSEWARLVAAITPDFTDPDTGGPLPGREAAWGSITGYRVRLAEAARDWPTATALQDAKTVWDREHAAAALAAPAAGLTSVQRSQIRDLAASLSELRNILLAQGDPDCLTHFREVLMLAQRIGDRRAEAEAAGLLGHTYRSVPGLRDLDQAEKWYRHSLSLRPDSDRLGLATALGSLGQVAMERFQEAREAREAEQVLQEQLNTALRSYHQALDLTPVDDHESRGITEMDLGNLYRLAGDTRQALRHYQQAIQHQEARGNVYVAGQTRYNIAVLLAKDDRVSDALHYARAALDNYRQAGPGAADRADRTRQLIADLEQRSH